jgi:glucose-6-phosphate 1-dehydrogenase
MPPFFFGATGDQAYIRIFPSLHSMAKRGTLNVPVIGVANSDGMLSRSHRAVRLK